MGVMIWDENGWRDETVPEKPAYDRNNPGPELGERPRERERLPFPPGPMPGLQEVPVTPANERQRHEWHPGLMRTPVAPRKPDTKTPVFH